MFMTLLTAQLENQTPFDPVDPMQFTQELVQFNMLDQLTQINNTLQQMSGAPTSSSQSSSNSATSIQGGN
jgi:flagellar basal-body rod modification protein FlgD